MASKNNPGQFDCYAAAKSDAPMFVLLGRDRHAPTLVRIWALLRAREGEDTAKVSEAFRCADLMDTWAIGLGKNPNLTATAFEHLLIAVSSPLNDHPEGYEHACDCFECRSCD